MKNHDIQVNDKNPRSNFGWTPLHSAARGGHLEICELITSNVEEKDPPDNNGVTPSKIVIEQSQKLLRLFAN